MTIKIDYPFLAHPPPTRPLPALPSSRPRRRSGTFFEIASWAARVQPGSPASPSPRTKRRRRPSVASIRLPSASFLHVAPTPTFALTPTPSVRDFKPDLTTVGYTSVFLQLPTPISATIGAFSTTSPFTKPAHNASPLPSPTSKPRGFTRFRSLSVLRSRGRSKSACPHSPVKMKAKAAAASSAAIVKRKKAKHAMLPPPLANELALMQFLDGGNTDTNIKRLMKAQAKASDVGLADVFRDSKSGVWRDQDEEWEYTHLLEERDESRPRATGDPQWVTFGGDMSPSAAGVPGEDRRGSMSTQDSNMGPTYVVQPADFLGGDDFVHFGSAVVPLATGKPALSVPSRPGRASQHLRKPVDAAFSRALASPKSPKLLPSLSLGTGVNPKGKARRRPAPLKLSPPSPAFKRPINSPIDTDKVRREFIDDSFEPAAFAPVNSAGSEVAMTTPADVRSRRFGNSRAINVAWRTVKHGPTNLGMKTKSSRLNMMGLFRSSGKEDTIV